MIHVPTYFSGENGSKSNIKVYKDIQPLGKSQNCVK